MTTAEPDRASFLIDKDGDVWRYDENAWDCLTNSAFGHWHELGLFAPFHVLVPQTDDGVGTPTVIPPAGAAVSPPAPSSPRLFELIRHDDISGVSGTGVVVEGAQWSDGSVSVRWKGANPSFANWPDVQSLIAVHGHDGATELRWIAGGE